ncbi:MAG: hypothetical protein ACRD09_03685 [Vicinamibacterales bacterium]
MDSPADKALRAIDAAVAEVARLSGRVALDEAYLRAVERVEAMPENQSGADKTWVSDAQRQFREHFRRARRR